MGEASLGLAAYLVRDWKLLQIITHLPLLGLILLYRIVPESPRWLIINGRIKEAKAIINQVGRENKRPVPHHLFSNNNTNLTEENIHVKEEGEEEKSRSVLSIFKSRRMGL